MTHGELQSLQPFKLTNMFLLIAFTALLFFHAADGIWCDLIVHDN